MTSPALAAWLEAGRLLEHLPGLHDQKEHGRRFNIPGDPKSGLRKAAKKLAGGDDKGPGKAGEARKRMSTVDTSTPHRAELAKLKVDDLRAEAKRRQLTPGKANKARLVDMIAEHEQRNGHGSVGKAVKDADELSSSTGRAPRGTPRDRLMKIYGDRLRVAQSGAQADKHLQHLDAIPEAFHRRVAEHFDDWFSFAGIYIGDGAVPELSPEAARLAGERPRGYSAGRTWDNVSGAYLGSERQLLIGDEKLHGHGSTSLAQHEFGHALDAALRQTSVKAEFKDIVRDLGVADPKSGFRLKGYYDQRGNPNGWSSEAFAEAFAAWAPNRASETDAIYTMVFALGHGAMFDTTKGKKERVEALHPSLLGPMRRLVRYFEFLEARMGG